MTPLTAQLLERVRGAMSEKRYRHTLGVERTVGELAQLYCPEKEELLRAAALCHDFTKEYTAAQTEAVLLREGITLRPDEAASPQILHAITAPAELRRLFPELACDELLALVRWHTTGHAGMTVEEALLYLADVIEPGRTYPACVALRERFFAPEPAKLPMQQRLAHLRDTVLCSLEGVRDSLISKNAPVCRETLEAIEDLKLRKTL